MEAVFRPPMTGVSPQGNIFTQRIITVMELCWDHEARKRPPFRQVRQLLDPFKRQTDAQPVPLPIFWHANTRLEFLCGLGTYLFSSNTPVPVPTMIPPAALTSARMQLAAQLDIAGGYITAGDWRVFFPPALIEQLADVPQGYENISALLRLLSFIAQRLLLNEPASWQEIIGVRSVSDLARYVDSCFPQLATHTYLVCRHFRPDLLTSVNLLA